MTVDATSSEVPGARLTSVALKRLLLLASLCVAIASAKWLLWLGSSYERNPLWAIGVFPVFQLAAATQCFYTATRLDGRQRKAWLFFSAGCLSFCVGDSMWAYQEAVLGITGPYGSAMYAFYLGFPLSFMIGTWYYRNQTSTTDDAFIQIANLGLILSASLLAALLAYTEFLGGPMPTYFATIQVASVIIGISSVLFVLVVLVGYARGRQRRVMGLIAASLCFATVTELTFLNQMMQGHGYQGSETVNSALLICLALIVWAAFEERHLKNANDAVATPVGIEASARNWESLLLPLTAAGVLVAILFQRERLGADLIPYVVTASLLFILSAAIRNWWGHRFETRLREKASRSQSELEATNRELASQNLELRKTHLELEQSQRRLAVHQGQLEGLVAKRTHELEQSRVALHRADRLASLGTLAAGLAHELNNPLGMMQLQADEALLEREEGPHRDTFRSILEQVGRCSEIVRGVLRFSRDEASQKRAVDLGDIARRSVELARQYSNPASVGIRCQIETEAGSASSTVLGCATELEQVVVNLLRNAIEASDKGSFVYVRLYREGDRLKLEIVDDGAGMTDETLEHAFDPFYTTRRDEGGTGLGLSIAHGIVSQHGGSLHVRSVEGEGTAVTMELAVHAES